MAAVAEVTLSPPGIGQLPGVGTVALPDLLLTESDASADPFLGPLVVVDLTNEQRIAIDRVVAGVAGAQLAANLVGEAQNGLTAIIDLLDQAAQLGAGPGGSSSPNQVEGQQEALDSILMGIEEVAEQTRFGGVQLLTGSFTGQGLNLGASGSTRSAKLELPDARLARLGSAAGGAPLASVLSGGPNALAVSPEPAMAIVSSARREATSALIALSAFQDQVVVPEANLRLAELNDVAVGGRAAPDLNFGVDAFAQALGQGAMGASLQAVYRSTLPRERWVRTLSEWRPV
jgi:hypothetical protein